MPVIPEGASSARHRVEEVIVARSKRRKPWDEEPRRSGMARSPRRSGGRLHEDEEDPDITEELPPDDPEMPEGEELARSMRARESGAMR